jgi:CrcB protein
LDRLRTALLLVAGGSLGTLARYAAGSWLRRSPGRGFPWATFAVNVSGCLAMGFVLTYFDERHPEGRAWRTLLAVGFLGAYTTFSTLGWETHSLLRDGDWPKASAYVLASVALGLAAVRLGVVAARACV